MGIIAQNKISSLGMLFGAIALMMGIIHFYSALFPHHRQRLKASWRTKRLKLKEVFSPE